MIVVEISAVPIGAGASLSRFIAEVLRVLEERGIKYQLNPMGTVFEIEDYAELCEVLKNFDKVLFEAGSERNYYVIKVDSRPSGGGMDQKVKSVMEKLQR